MAAIAAEELVAEEVKVGVGGGDYAWKMRRSKINDVRVCVLGGKLHLILGRSEFWGLGRGENKVRRYNSLSPRSGLPAGNRLWETATKKDRGEERDGDFDYFWV